MLNRVLSKVFSILLITLPLICFYDIYIITPALFFCVVGLFFAVIWIANGNRIIIDLRSIPYILYVLLSTFFALSRANGIGIYTIVIKMILYFFIFLLFYVLYWQMFDKQFAVKLYVYISVVITVLMFVQFIFGYLGKSFSLLPHGVPLVGEEIITSEDMRLQQLSTKRFSTFFLEPAHQVEYILPCLSIVLFRKNKEKSRDICLSLFLTAGIFMTTSSIGILGSIIIWSFYLLYLLVSGKIKREYWFIFLIPILICGVLYFLRDETVILNLTERLKILNIKNSERTEGYRRIRYGWLCYGRLNLFRKLFGIGYKNTGYYLAESGIGPAFLASNDVNILSYSSGITGMLLGLGLVGTILNFRLYIFDALRSKSIQIYALLLVWGIFLFTASIFDELSTFMIVVFIMHDVYGESNRIIKNPNSINLTRYLYKRKGQYIKHRLIISARKRQT